jgi:hypothetical protein
MELQLIIGGMILANSEETKPKKDTQSRKYAICQNNPLDYGFDHEKIKVALSNMKSISYYIMSDEIGEEGTYHTHIFTYSKSPIRYSTMCNNFPHADVKSAFGTCQQNRDYILKQGKWTGTEKSTTSVPGTTEEFGTLPDEHQGQKPELAILYDMVKSGYSNFEIIEHNSDFLFDIAKIEMVRLTVRQEEYKNKWRDLEVIYIFGKTGTGKTRGVMEKYGYENVYRSTSYQHPFDLYKGEDVIVFEEFNSSIKINDMLSYIDGYPVSLECRYANKIACFTKVYILSNVSLEKQYPNVKDENFSTWQAFIRRIHKVVWYKSETEIINYTSSEEFFNRDHKSGLPVRFMEF